MNLHSQTEIEQKFDVHTDVSVPSMNALPGVASVDRPVTQHLEAVYYDTPELDLAGAGITLRRRTGGTDAGWHLKLPLGGHAREELRLPPGSASDIPDPLLKRTRIERRGRAVAPVARISTHREVIRLRDHRGRVLAELADDRVQGRRLPTGPRLMWREWEVELVEGSPAFLGISAELLLRAGATTPAQGSKLARVLGDPQTGAEPSPVRTVGDLLTDYLGEQVLQLHREAPLVRTGSPDSVHKMRVAARRARSVVDTFVPVLEPGSSDRLGHELRWLGVTLGDARDAEVLASRMHSLLRAEPDSPVRRAVSEQIAHDLAARSTRGEARARELLESDRYHRLLDSLDSWVTSPPLTEAASKLEAAQVAGLVEREWRRLRRRAGAAANAPTGDHRDRALHDVRKAAKRLRYAAEAAVPALGDRARTLAASATALQDVLGEHHDSVVARDLLIRVRGEVSSGEADDGLDRLYARESARTGALEHDYEAAVHLLMGGHPGSWLLDGPLASVPAQRSSSPVRRGPDDEG